MVGSGDILDLAFVEKELKPVSKKKTLVWREPGARDVFCVTLELGV